MRCASRVGHASASDTLDLVEVGRKMENGLVVSPSQGEPFVEFGPAKFTLLRSAKISSDHISPTAISAISRYVRVTDSLGLQRAHFPGNRQRHRDHFPQQDCQQKQSAAKPRARPIRTLCIFCILCPRARSKARPPHAPRNSLKYQRRQPRCHSASFLALLPCLSSLTDALITNHPIRIPPPRFPRNERL